MEKDGKGIYGNAETMANKDKPLPGGENAIYGEAEKLAQTHTEEAHAFMAGAAGKHEEAAAASSPTEAAATEISHEESGVYGKASEFGEKDKQLPVDEEGIYGEAEELAKKNTEEIHKFMAE